MIRTCMENIQDKPVKQARRKLCHPEGGGGVGGGVGWVEKKRKKKELGSGLRFFTRKLLIKNKLFLRILAK